MDVKVEILGRSTIDQPFTVLGSQTVVLSDDKMAVTPIMPPAAAGKELRVRVSSVEGVKFVVGSWLDPATVPGPTPILDKDGNQVGTNPSPMPAQNGLFGVWGGAVSQGVDFPALGGSLIIGRHGVSLP